jgi:hypothetical protein
VEIKTITIKDWGQLLELEPELGGSVYRGQSNLEWELETSLRRTIINNDKHCVTDEPDDGQFAFAERMSLRNFKSRAHFYLNHLPSVDDLIGWLAVMQHHGAPTRLLDFSYSLYISIYFALINTTTDSCVWAINDNWLRAQGTIYSADSGFLATNDLRFGQLSAIYKTANSIISENNFDNDNGEDAIVNPAIMMLELDQQIPRLAIQQGLFLMPTNIQKSFVTNLKSMYDQDQSHTDVITKLIFPIGLRYRALSHLKMMNITAETLFPGIDGFAVSLIQQVMI